MNAGNASDSVKKFYYFFEDKYYALLDKVNKALPVYSVVDPIDRIFPSFLLCLVLLFLLLWLLLSSFVPWSPAQGLLRVQVVEKSSLDPLVNLHLKVIVNEGEESLRMGTDANGFFDLNYPLDTEFEFSIAGDEFKPLTKEFTLTEAEQSLQIQLERAFMQTTWSQRTVKFVDKDGDYVRDNIKTTFKCSNLEAEDVSILPRDAANFEWISTGRVDISYPENCDRVLVSVEAANYDDLIDEDIRNGTVVLTLSGGTTPSDMGTVYVQVFDHATNSSIGKKVKILVFECTGSAKDSCEAYSLESKTTSVRGEKSFESAPGWYYLRATDTESNAGEYLNAETEPNQVSAGDTTSFEISMQKQSSDENNITVNVFDANSNSPLKADISLYKKSDYSLVSEAKNSETAVFALTENTQYEAWVQKEGFISHKGGETLGLGDSLDVELIPLTAETAGSVQVEVLQENGDRGPSDTKVYLYYSGGALADRPAYGPKNLGIISGKASFELIEPGNYYAFAKSSRFFLEGKSTASEVIAQQATEYYLTMQKLNGSLKINVFDLDDSDEIRSFEVEFFDAGNDSSLQPKDSNIESNTYTFGAGTRVYAIVSSSGYETHRTSSILVEKERVKEWSIYLDGVDIDGPEITFLQITDLEGETTGNIELGQEYLLHFNAHFDPLQEFSYASLHFRVGKDSGAIAEDPLTIESIYPNDSLDENISVKKSTHFSGTYSPENFTRDYETSAVSAGSSKWIELEFKDPTALNEIYSFEVSLRVSIASGLHDLEGLQVKYKALVLEDDDMVSSNSFFPAQDLASLEPLHPDKFLYAATEIKPLSLCSSQTNFCFLDSVSYSGDNEACQPEDLGGNKSGVRFGCEYEWFFVLINYQSDLLSPTPTLLVSNKQVSGTTAIDANTVSFDSFDFSSASDSSITNPFSTQFPSKSIITSSTAFSALEIGTDSGLWIELEQGASMVYSTQRMLSIRGQTATVISLSHDKVTPFGDTREITVTVSDQYGTALENTTVEVLLEDRASVSETLYTDGTGSASFTLIADNQMPGTVFWFRAYDDEADDYVWASLEVIESGIVSITDYETTQEINTENPLRISFLEFLGATQDQKTRRVVLTNISTNVAEEAGSIPEKIIEIAITIGEGAEFLDTEGMLSLLTENYLNNSIASNGTNFDFKVLLSGEPVTENVFVSGTIDLNLLIGAQETRLFEIPFEVSIIFESSDLVRVEDLEGNELSTDNRLPFALLVEEMDSTSNSFVLKNISSPSREIIIDSFALQAQGEDLNQGSILSGLESLKEAQVSIAGTTVPFEIFLSQEGREQLNTNQQVFFLLIPIRVGAGVQDLVVVPFVSEFITIKDLVSFLPESLSFNFSLENKQPHSMDLTVESSLGLTPLQFKIDSIELDEANWFESVFPTDPIQFAPGHEETIPITLTLDEEVSFTEYGKTVPGKLNAGVEVLGHLVEIEKDIAAVIVQEEIIIEGDGFKIETCPPGLGALNSSGLYFDVNFAFTGCGIGRERVCSTGETALPKVLLSWKWSDFSSIQREYVEVQVDPECHHSCSMEQELYAINGACDENLAVDATYDGFVFCDATQFSIELVSKLKQMPGSDEDGLEKLMDFNAFMMADSFSDDFIEDFLDWTLSTFSESPGYFIRENSIIRSYFEDNRIEFVDEDFGQYYAGLYNVKISFNSDKARGNFLNGRELTENQKIYVDFTFLKSPERALGSSSVFYYLPFNGNVGLNTNGKFERTGYGLNYGLGPGGSVFLLRGIEEGIELLNSVDSSGTLLVIDKPISLFESVSTENNGKLMVLSWQGASRELLFNPTYATPLALKMRLEMNEVSGPARVYYSLKEEREGGPSVQGLGEEFLVWNGLGGATENCYDFSGIDTKGEEYFDEQCNALEDGSIIPNLYSTARRIAWQAPSYGGNLALSSVAYAPVWGQKYWLKVAEIEDEHTPFSFVSMSSPDSEEDPFLGGISGMNLNSRFGSVSSYVDSVQEVLDLVEQEFVCVENIGNQSIFYWNEEKIIQEGRNRVPGFNSLFEQAIDADGCITVTE